MPPVTRSQKQRFLLGPPCCAAAFEVISESHTGARPSVRLCVGLITPPILYEGPSNKSDSVKARYPDILLSDLRSAIATSRKSGKTEKPVLEFRFCTFKTFKRRLALILFLKTFRPCGTVMTQY